MSGAAGDDGTIGEPKARRGREAIEKAATPAKKMARLNSTHAMGGASGTSAAQEEDCNRMFAARIGSLRRMKWPQADAFAAICALRTQHQGSERSSNCPKGCFHSDQRLRDMVEEIYEAPVLPWNDDILRMQYIKDFGANPAESLLLLTMCHAANGNGYCKALHRQDELVRMLHMNKSDLAKAQKRLHNRGVIDLVLGSPRKGTSYQLNVTPLDRKPEDRLQVDDDSKGAD